MELHKNKELFKEAITATAQLMNIPEIYIEKDYWVTLALQTIFTSPVSEYTVFKGGTALSKCHKLIQRFSEDIDIVVIRKPEDNGNRLTNKIKAISKLVNRIMPEVEITGITQKMGMNRKTAHQYEHAGFTGIYGQVREHIIIEATWLGNPEPYNESVISCYIADMMQSKAQQNLINEYKLLPFSVKVLTKERTICEKIMSLVRFSYSKNPYIDLGNKIRHIYDIHFLLKDPDVDIFFRSQEFDKMINMVGKEDIYSFKNNNSWLESHPKDALIYAFPEATWEKIKTPYRTTFKDLVLGTLPAEIELIADLEKIASRLTELHWELEVVPPDLKAV